MEVIRPAQSFDIRDSSAVAQARRTISHLASDMGFPEGDTGRVSLVATEMATNLLKHSGGGELIATATQASAGRCGLDLLALDNGPGIEDKALALTDGYSTAGSPGTGLGAIRRQSQLFDLYSTSGGGTAVLARLLSPCPPAQRRTTFDVGGLSIPVRGETVSGDCWTAEERPGGLRIVGADGLGHGPGAAEASQAACRVAAQYPTDAPGVLMEKTHHALRPTRGAAVSIADIDLGAGRIAFASIGNVNGTLVTAGAARKMVSHNGTVGHVARHFRALDYPFAGESVFILHSDGLTTSWQLDRYPGLLHCASGLIAGILYRDFKRGRDDAMVVVAKWGTA